MFYVQHAYVGKSNDDEDDSKDVLAIFRISGKYTMRPKIVSWHDKQCKQLLGSRIKLRNFEISDYVVKRIPISLNEQ